MSGVPLSRVLATYTDIITLDWGRIGRSCDKRAGTRVAATDHAHRRVRTGCPANAGHPTLLGVDDRMLV